MMQKSLLFESSAIKECLVYLKQRKNYSWRNIYYINQGRYAIVAGNPNIAITFKKDWFQSFGDKKFKTEDGLYETGIGDTLNKDDLRLFIANNVSDIYIVYKNGAIYTINLKDFLLHSHNWVNKEGKEVRSISIHRYKRVNDEV